MGLQTPHRRLLDLLAGWEQYVDFIGSPNEANAIAELYQQAGRKENMTRTEIYLMLTGPIVDILWTGKTNGGI